MFINTTPFDLKVKKAFNNTYHFVVLKKTLPLAALILVWSVVSFLQEKLTLGIVTLIMAIIIPLTFHLLLPIMIMKNAKKNGDNDAQFSQGIVQTYTFSDDVIRVTSNHTSVQGKVLTLNYSDINKVSRVPGFIIFMTKDNLGHALSAAGMENGTARDLYKFLKTKTKTPKAN